MAAWTSNLLWLPLLLVIGGVFFMVNRVISNEEAQQLALKTAKQPLTFKQDNRTNKLLPNAITRNDKAYNKANNKANEIADESASNAIRLGFCIMVHSREGLLRADMLIRLLYKPNHVFVIHVDAKLSDDDLAFVKDLLPKSDNVIIIRKISGARFSFTLVEIFLESINVIRTSHPNVDYVLNLSGDTYPLHTIDEIEKFLSRSSPKSFLGRWCQGMFSGCSKNMQVKLKDHQKFLDCLKTKTCNNLTDWWDDFHYMSFGDQWVVLHRNFLDFMFNETLSNFSRWIPIWRDRFFTPDEWVFQTFANLPTRPAATVPVVWRSLTYVEITRNCAHPVKTERTHPCWLTKSHALRASAGISQFARKFLNVPCYLPNLRTALSECKQLPETILSNSTIYP